MLEFVFWDVQHGHATYIRTPNNRHIVVDLGTGSFANQREFSPLLHLKSQYGVRQLDFVAITHPHRDHIDDIFNFAELAPKTLHRPTHLSESEIRGGNQSRDSQKIDKYLEISSSYNSPVDALGDPRRAESWGGVKWRYFVPTSCDRKNLNNHSAVHIFEFAHSKVMIPGDNEKASWMELLQNSDFREAAKNIDVLLAPHHGRDAGFCDELLDHATPRSVIISDGPECDTSATAKYGAKVTKAHGEGWRTYYPDQTYEPRLCLTTRTDGVIRVKLGTDADGKPYLQINVGKGSSLKKAAGI